LARIRYEFSKSVYESYPGTRRQGDADYLSVLVNYEEAKYELSTHHIHSPLDGIFAKGWAVAGDVVQADQTIVSINEYKPIWVSAFIEESKIKNIHIGQKAQISVDAYKDLKITGTIYYIADNTASEFSLVSTSNASGNFTKTSQRIQIKVSIDSVGNSKNINYKLLSGMSVSLKIRKKNN
jgi:Multidrug resistance efflux pump